MTRVRPSRSLYEYGQAQRFFMLMNMITGAAIWFLAGLTEKPLATLDEYGSFINALSAEVWAIPLCMGAALHLIGQVVNGDKRLRPWVTPLWRLIGSVLVFAVMAAFTFGGLSAPLALWSGVHFVQSGIFAMIGGWIVWLAIGDLIAGIRRRKAEQ